jgi:hypothetical protein
MEHLGGGGSNTLGAIDGYNTGGTAYNFIHFHVPNKVVANLKLKFMQALNLNGVIDLAGRAL